jgi:lantibiotic modifying enzyme
LASSLAAGRSGIAYALATLAKVMAAPELGREAVRWSMAIESAAAEQTADLLLGDAGAIVGVLAAYEQTAERRLLRQAASFGERLVRLAAEPGRSAAGVTGLAHGAAGISLALFRLAAATGEQRFFEAAAALVEREQRLFSPAHGNWPDLRNPGAPYAHNHKWCSGAPGIGLGRLSSLPAVDAPGLRRVLLHDVRRAADFLLAQPPGRIDHLCCGNWGRLAIAHSLSRGLPHEARLAAHVAERAELLLGRYRGLGSYRISAEFGPIYRPGFFKGLAGLGYTLLRLVRPSLPDVLAFQ